MNNRLCNTFQLQVKPEDLLSEVKGNSILLFRLLGTERGQQKKQERCKAPIVRLHSTPAKFSTTVPGWQAKSTRAKRGPLHAHTLCGLKGVTGSGARQGHGGTQNTPPILPQGSWQPAWPESSGGGHVAR